HALRVQSASVLSIACRSPNNSLVGQRQRLVIRPVELAADHHRKPGARTIARHLAPRTLVQWKLPDFEWQASGQKKACPSCTAVIRSGNEFERNFEGTAASPARALLGAFLRAVRERHGA
ncbi:hypothetical protein AB4Z40_35615, partial [Bosea sp. 2YAB26]|uniref:hypothetical protein n=1 Tax=Bosea sp. 2YAB26 TaxID=3237478 RepID=UPI003F92B66F